MTVFNPLGHTRTEVVSVQVPVCAVSVRDAEGKPVKSQVRGSVLVCWCVSAIVSVR